MVVVREGLDRLYLHSFHEQNLLNKTKSLLDATNIPRMPYANLLTHSLTHLLSYLNSRDAIESKKNIFFILDNYISIFEFKQVWC